MSGEGSFRLSLGLAVALLLLSAGSGGALCVGDCPVPNDVVSIGELVTGVNIALGNRPVNACPAFDPDTSLSVEVNELIQGVRNALNGCPTASVSPTGTAFATETPTFVATPTPTPTLAGGAVIVYRGIADSEDVVHPPTSIENQIPVFELPQGRFFRLIIEAASGTSSRPPGLAAFRNGAPPDLQIHASRDLGDGNPQVCDSAVPDLGVPGLSPPRFDADAASVDALNDFGCRFPDGEGRLFGRGCADAGCVLFEDGLRGCVAGTTQVQFCSRSISVAESFPPGDTLLSMRVVDVRGAPGPVVQMIIRVAVPE